MAIRPNGTDDPRKTYLWILLVPFAFFLAVASTFLALDVGLDEHDEVISSVIVCVITYHVLTLIMNAVVVVVTIHTRKTVYDNIHVRGELILQTAVLWISYTIYFSIYLCDALNFFDADNEEYTSVFYLAFFVEHSLFTLLSIIIGTQYVSWNKMWQKQKRQDCSIPHLPRNVSKERTHSVSMSDVDMTSVMSVSNTILSMEFNLVDLQSVITMGDGLQEFMAHLAKGNQLYDLIVKLIACL